MKTFFLIVAGLGAVVFWQWDWIQKDIAEGRELRWERQDMVCSTHGGYAYSSNVQTGFLASQWHYICKDGTSVPAR